MGFMPDYQHRITIISGNKNAGKTKLCLNLKEQIESAGHTVKGIISPGLYQGRDKIGILSIDIASGRQRQIAQYSPGWDPQQPEREWLFDPQAIKWANSKIKLSVPTEYLIIDEIGYLELEKNSGWTAALHNLDKGFFQQAIVVIRPDLLEIARMRWKNVKVVMVQPDEDLRALSRSLWEDFCKSA
jgi:nucleoside-triphosphatase THEP1